MIFATAYIANGAALASAARTYTIANNSNSSSNANDEGSTVVFTISVDDNSTASKVYVSTVDGTAIAGEDYTALAVQEVFGVGESSKTVSVNLLGDAEIDDDETFYLEVYKSKQDVESGTTTAESKAFINNTTVTDNFLYNVTTSNGSSNPAQEGNAVTFMVTRNGDTGSTTVYISSSSGSAKYLSGDFTKITAQPVTFANGETTKTFTVSTVTDSNTEGKEYFWFDVYKNKADAEADYWANSNGYTAGYITDGSGSPIIEADGSSVPSSYTYTITNINSVLGNSGKVIEGDDAVFNVTRSGSGSESTIYVSTFICDDEVGCANISDFNSLDHFAVNFGKDDLVKEVRVSTILDDINEANEFLSKDE